MIRDILKKMRPVTVAINFKAVAGPWGGASVFIVQLKQALELSGIRVCFDLKRRVDLILMIDPREDLQRTAFGLQDIIRYKNDHPNVKIVHRINECDQRKNTDFMDEILSQGNEVADYTIFISEWLKEYFSKQWFEPSRPHNVIYNGADLGHFHPIGTSTWKKGEPMRFVTHHWSDNPLKGFPVYEQMDELIADGTIKDTELWIIGRWPKDIHWKSARTFPPASGEKLGDLLRQCHAYITASVWEPCGMHHVEGAQCGLPLLSHVHGGGIVEAAEKYGLLFEDNLVEAIGQMQLHYPALREKVLLNMPSGGRMNADYIRIIQYVLAHGNRG